LFLWAFALQNVHVVMLWQKIQNVGLYNWSFAVLLVWSVPPQGFIKRYVCLCLLCHYFSFVVCNAVECFL